MVVILNVAPSSKLYSLASSPWSKVVLLYRRICLLRARALHAEAEELHAGDFSRALSFAESEAASAGESDIPERVRSLLAAEEERVANAGVLAEMLAPLLETLLQPLLNAAHAPVPLAAQALAPRATTVQETSRASSSPPSLSIADFIEGMLLQEKSSLLPATPRHAS